MTTLEMLLSWILIFTIVVTVLISLGITRRT
jgi:hypothetical protein